MFSVLRLLVRAEHNFDLPGLIHSANKNQSKEDVDFVRDLVDEYIGNQRTIIFAVVSAKNDYANQIILKKARDFNQNGSRTLGLIAKPDFLDAGSENELSWIELGYHFFELGLHILKPDRKSIRIGLFKNETDLKICSS